MNSASEDHLVFASRWETVAFVLGLTVWLLVQGYLILMPVFARSEPPEPDDILPYIARTARMEKCFWGDCLALQDLTAQFSVSSPNAEVATYRSWASTVFGSNQLGYSFLLLVMKKFGLDFMAGYRVASVFGVLLFGAGFAALLRVLWGKSAAGFALVLLAFKTFPDSGLNFVVPSNLCMGLATLVWARIISRNGKALWTLGVGSIVLIAFHPTGAAYALVAGALALAFSGVNFGLRRWIVIATVTLILAVALLVPARVFNLLEYFSSVHPGELLAQGTLSFLKVAVEVIPLAPGLIGSLPLFLACVALGFVTASRVHRERVAIFVKIYVVFLGVSLFYPPRQPGDTFFRLWIPLVVVIFGSIGMACRATHVLGWEVLERLRGRAREAPWPRIQELWPLFVWLIVTGYVVQMSVAGAEQIVVMSEHYKNRQPLKVCRSQTDALLARAEPGDRVLYKSSMLMQRYFTEGALQIGAVYHDSTLKETEKGTETEWLHRPDLRFAVTYNPLVIHPGFQGLHERRWGISSPFYIFAPSDERRHGPILHEDYVAVRRLKHVDVEWGQQSNPKSMTVLVDNPGGESWMRVSPLDDSGQPSEQLTISVSIPPRSGQGVSWQFEGEPDLAERTGYRHSNSVALKIDLDSLKGARRLRLLFPVWNSPVRIVGLRFDDSHLNWPWEHKARLSVTGRSWEFGTTSFSFDPTHMLPKTLQERPVRVINDCGSSVLLEILHFQEDSRK